MLFRSALGGMTSHAAVVARGLGKPCVAGCSAISIEYRAQEFIVGGTRVKRGDWITIDGATGEVMLGKVATINSQVDKYFTRFMAWVDAHRKLRVRANADIPRDAKAARLFGAEGIGLCRTEHMFFGEGKIEPMREMILADTVGVPTTQRERLFPAASAVPLLAMSSLAKMAPALARAKDARQRELRAEYARLLYVALTRARDALKRSGDAFPRLGYIAPT